MAKQVRTKYKPKSFWYLGTWCIFVGVLLLILWESPQIFYPVLGVLVLGVCFFAAVLGSKILYKRKLKLTAEEEACGDMPLLLTEINQPFEETFVLCKQIIKEVPGGVLLGSNRNNGTVEARRKGTGLSKVGESISLYLDKADSGITKLEVISVSFKANQRIDDGRNIENIRILHKLLKEKAELSKQELGPLGKYTSSRASKDFQTEVINQSDPGIFITDLDRYRFKLAGIALIVVLIFYFLMRIMN